MVRLERVTKEKNEGMVGDWLRATGANAGQADGVKTGREGCGEGQEVIINSEPVQKADVGGPLFRGQACNTRRTNGETPTSMFRRRQAYIERGLHSTTTPGRTITGA